MIWLFISATFPPICHPVGSPWIMHSDCCIICCSFSWCSPYDHQSAVRRRSYSCSLAFRWLNVNTMGLWLGGFARLNLRPKSILRDFQMVWTVAEVLAVVMIYPDNLTRWENRTVLESEGNLPDLHIKDGLRVLEECYCICAKKTG